MQKKFSTGLTTDIPVGTNKNKYQLIPTVSEDQKKPFYRVYDVDHLYKECVGYGVINPQFKAWYMKVFYHLGIEKCRVLARVAKADGKVPPALFSYLLKKNLKEAGIDEVQLTNP